MQGPWFCILTGPMSKPIPTPIAIALIAGFSATWLSCSSTQKKFDRITPGMSPAEVSEAMDEGPSKFEKIANTEYTSWYWGEDYCVLFQGDKVVTKVSALEGNTASAGPVSYEEKVRAQCLAPGQTAKSSTERSVNIPGIGTVKIPGGNLDGGG